MPQYEVQFLSGLKANYTALQEKNPYAFYYCTDSQELFLGEELLNNADDLAAAVSRIAANESAISGLTSSVSGLTSSVGSLQSAVDTLNGDASTEGSVRKITADAVATIIADAPEALNDLREISDWIIAHTDDATAMNSAIIALQNLCGEIPQGAQSTDIISYIAEYFGENGYNPFNVEKPNDVLIIPENAYSASRTVTTLSFPNALVAAKKCCWDAESLQTISIPKVQRVEESAFESCIMLQSIDIPAAVYVGKNAFAMCMFATSFNAPLAEFISDGAVQNTNITKVDLPCVHYIGDAAFGGSFQLEEINIPHVHFIGNGGFQDSREVEELTLYEIKKIDSGAFYDCPKLKEVYIYTDYVPECGYEIFRQTPMDTADATSGEIEGKIYVKGYLVDAFKAAENWSDYADCFAPIPGTELTEELPPASVSDAGKVLKVDSNGQWSKGDDNSTIYWRSF